MRSAVPYANLQVEEGINCTFLFAPHLSLIPLLFSSVLVDGTPSMVEEPQRFLSIALVMLKG